MSLFRDRSQAGERLAALLPTFPAESRVVVLGLPRGGVPVALELARALSAPLDIFSVRKLGAPTQPELALGAIATGGIYVVNQDLIEFMGIGPGVIDALVARERAELERREQEYRGDSQAIDLAGATVLMVDDGLATGASMRAGLTALREARPERVIVAIPVAPPETLAAIRRLTDQVLCIATPDPFYSVGAWYARFDQVSDDEVRRCLQEARSWAAPQQAKSP
ncbi:MAG: phosphoribosyltransferase [Chloroflexi bacterium]|nr:phosphoribosyltransferase [Chloroflexota bacterium]